LSFNVLEDSATEHGPFGTLNDDTEQGFIDNGHGFRRHSERRDLEAFYVRIEQSIFGFQRAVP